MRRHRNRRRNNQSKIIIPGVICLLVVMTIGYAAFNTQINVNVKGNIKEKTAGQKLLESVNVVDNGDGLYIDTAEEGRYIYRGSNPNNYITFNDEIWRIMSIESDGTIKIIRKEQLSSTQYWDGNGNRSSSTSTYCTNASDYGCNAWAATSNLVGTPSEFTQYYNLGNPTSYSNIYSGTVTGDASLNTYLNGIYYNSLINTVKNQIIKGTFNISSPGNGSDTEILDINAEQEKQYQWQGYIALATITEYLKTSTASECTSLNSAYNSSTPCGSNNWLWPTFDVSEYEWTLSSYVSHGGYTIWVAWDRGERFTSSFANGLWGLRPTLYLSSGITLSGEGTESQPYTIN